MSVQSTVESTGERRFLGAVWALAAIGGIAGASLAQPFSEWTGFGWAIAAVLVLLGLVGLWMLITGKGHVLNPRVSPKTQGVIAVIGLVGSAFVVVGNLVTDEGRWTALDALTVAVWIAVGVMFAISVMSLARIAQRS
jgi:hypothetical protein